MWKALGVIVVICVAGITLAIAGVVTNLHHSAYGGTCTAAERTKTHDALNAMNGFDRASNGVVRLAGRDRKNPYSPISRLSDLTGGMWARHFGHDLIAADLCNHAYIPRQQGGPLSGMPATATYLRPHVDSENEAWELAVCAGIARPQPPGVDDVPGLRKACAVRKSAWAASR